MRFITEEGIVVSGVTADQMREIDRIAVQEFGLTLLQMMENAGRNLAENVLDMLDGTKGPVLVLAGGGGNGGGGLCCARHLHNRGFGVSVVMASDPDRLGDAATKQLRILRAAGIEPVAPGEVEPLLWASALVVDALIGYGLRQAPRPAMADLIESVNRSGARVLSLDVPSGLNATTGDALGALILPERTLTLALPKRGLKSVSGELYLGDIGIPPEAYMLLGIPYVTPFAQRYWLPLQRLWDPADSP